MVRIHNYLLIRQPKIQTHYITNILWKQMIGKSSYLYMIKEVTDKINNNNFSLIRR